MNKIICWIGRDNKCKSGLGIEPYAIFADKQGKHKPAINSNGLWQGARAVEMCDRVFEELFDIRLAPGEGPIKVEISIEEVEK